METTRADTRDWGGAQWREPRGITYRIEVEGILRLLSPAHFGNGDTEDAVDMPLMRDPLSGTGLLTGTSLAGALRNYLWEREFGYGVTPQPGNDAHQESWATLLFGGKHGDDQGDQSALIVDDALAENAPSEVRDGVRIDPMTRTAKDTAKFDIELLQTGVTFNLHFELIISGDADNESKLREALAIALQGLESGQDITLGARKRRGYGACQVVEWRVRTMDLHTSAGLLAWLRRDGAWQSGPQIMALLYPDQAKASANVAQDRRHRLDLHATFAIAPDSSLLIRGIVGALNTGPDAMHIHRPELDTYGKTTEAKAILPGTSWAGAIRSQALRIAKTLHGEAGVRWIEQIFGGENEAATVKQEHYIGGRVEVGESVLEGVGAAQSMVVNRIAIDRFTGGVLDNLLFDEMPLYGGAETRLVLRLRLRNPHDAEIGLLLQVLKELWLGDLAVGGGAAIGRGRLQGLAAIIEVIQPDGEGMQTACWELERTTETGVRVTPRHDPLRDLPVRNLEEYAAALLKWPKEG